MTIRGFKWLWAVLLLPSLVWADDFVLNRDYKLVAKPDAHPSTTQVQVREFFSYGCPACYAIEPTLEAWLKTKPKDVDFERTPVIFHQSWYILAKAYYTVKDLNMEAKLNPEIFDALHQQHKDLSDRDKMQAYLETQGVTIEQFNNYFDFSPGIDAQIKHGEDLMTQYQIFQIPTFVVNGTYQTDLAMLGGDPKKLAGVLNFLINKSKTAH